MINTPHCPCNGCNERTIECHSKCDKYLEWTKYAKSLTEKYQSMSRARFYSKERLKPVRRRK